MSLAGEEVAALVARCIRDDGARLRASLIGQLGDFALAEDVLQDAAESALRHWRNGPPASPVGWLLKVARRIAIDRLRRDATLKKKVAQLEELYALEAEATEIPSQEVIGDERLRLIFTCCHPALEEKTRIALTLRSVCGLTTAEIAAAFVDSEAAMAQRLVRARKKISKARIPFAVPEPEDWPARLSAVLTVLYLIFSEGYASAGAEYRRPRLCDEALRLARLLRELCPEEAELEGLLALMLLTHARYRARLGPEGRLIVLAEQDRTLWDRECIDEALPLIETALRRGMPGPFQIQAAIAALHAEAPSHAQVDFRQIALLYGELERHRKNPIDTLNRIAALSEVEGAQRAHEMLGPLRAHLSRYQPLYALEADLLRRMGKDAEAMRCYEQAAELSENAPESAFLLERAAEARQRLADAADDVPSD